MVQVIGTTGEMPEFELPVSVLQPWLGLISSSVREAELVAVEHAINAACNELEASHHAEHALSRLQCGFPQDAMDWFSFMLHSLHRASWHWEQAAAWLKDHGDEQRTLLYQPLCEQVLTYQQRLTALVERFQGQMARYCQEWEIAFPHTKQ